MHQISWNRGSTIVLSLMNNTKQKLAQTKTHLQIILIQKQNTKGNINIIISPFSISSNTLINNSTKQIHTFSQNTETINNTKQKIKKKQLKQNRREFQLLNCVILHEISFTFEQLKQMKCKIRAKNGLRESGERKSSLD